MTNPHSTVASRPTAPAISHEPLGWIERRVERLRREPRAVQLGLDLAGIGFAALLPFRVLPPDFLFHCVFVTLVGQAFLFGLRPTIWRVAIWAVVITGYVAAAGLGAPVEPMEFAEWPLMFVIAALVAWMADRQMATARLYADLFRRASDRLLTVQEDERRRIARELHDGVGQLLTALQLRLEAAMPTDRERPDGEAVADARDLATEALFETRRIANRLRPARLDQVGLVAAVRDLTQHAGVPVEFDIAASVDDRRLDRATTAEAYRIVQEALSNVARHAAAGRVRIEFDVVAEWLRIRIVDDGRGFNPSKVTGSGLGLIGMEERALLLGGRLTIDSAPGRGTTVEVLIPRAPEPAPEPLGGGHAR